MSERELVLMAKNGDVDDFCALYDIYKDRLYGYAYYKLENCSDAEDAVQSCVLSAFQQIGILKRAEAFSSWIFKILNCCCTSVIKDQIKRRNTDDIESCINLPSYSSEIDIERQELKQALSVLKEEDREIVLLSFVGGFKSHEIAKICGLSAVNVRQRLSRSLARLKKELV